MDIIKETAEKYQPLFNLMSEEHGLTLTMSEMDDIIAKVDEVKQLFIPIVSQRSELLNLKAKSKHKEPPKDNVMGYIIQEEC